MAKAKKMNQWIVFSVNASDIKASGRKMVAPDAAVLPVAVLETRILRQSKGATGHEVFDPKGLLKQEIVLRNDKDDLPVASRVYVAKEFIILKVDEIADGSEMITSTYELGFYWEGRHYQRAIKSPSQERTDKAMFTCLDRDQVRMDDSFGAPKFLDTVTPVVIAKTESRYGLGSTSTKEIVGDFTHCVIKDAYSDILIDGKFMNANKRMESMTQKVVTNLSDGQGYCSIKWAAFMAMSIGILRNKEYVLIEEEWAMGVTIHEMMQDEKLARIIAKIPMVWQIRHAGDKGILVVWDYSQEKVELLDGSIVHAGDYDVLFTDGMHKYSADPNYPLKPNMEVASYIKKGKNVGYLNYQFLQGLNISAKTLISIAQDSLSYLENGVLQDYDKAMKFLGVIDYNGEEATEEGEEDSQFEQISVRSKVVEALIRNPRALKDKYVQKNLRYLCKTFIEDMRKGKLPLTDSAFRFVVRDPGVHFGGPILLSTEAYYNGCIGSYAAFRAPAIDSSEYVKMMMVEKAEYAHLTDCVIINAFDDWAARMGGMDFDGDKVFVTADRRIVDAIRGGKVIFAENPATAMGKSVPKFAFTWENIIRHDLSVIGTDMIGILTNIATTVTDKINCGKLAFDQGKEYVEQLRVLQGMAIDSAKTGDRVNLQEYTQFDDLRKQQPHWLEPTNPKVTVYHSTSPVGQLYDFIMGEVPGSGTGYLAEFLKVNKQQGGDFRLDLPHILDLEEVQGVKPIVQELEAQYCQELGLMMTEERRKMDDVRKKNNTTMADVEDYVSHERARIYDKYSQLTSSINADPRSVAGAAYLIAYGKESDSVSFPWVACTEGMMMLLSEMGQDISYKLVPVRGDLQSVDEITVENHRVDGNNAFARCADGTYPVVMVEDRSYARVPFTLKARARKNMIGNQIVFQIKGFEFHGTNEAGALKAIATAGGQGELRQIGQNDINRLALYIGGKSVAVASFSAKEYDEFAVAQFDGLCVAIDVSNIVAQVKNPKMKYKGLFTMNAQVIACLIPVQEAVEDYVIRTAWYWDIVRVAKEEIGFEDVTIHIAPDLKAGEIIGSVHVSFQGAKYEIFMRGIAGGTVEVDREMSEGARAFLCQQFSEALGVEVSRRRTA